MLKRSKPKTSAPPPRRRQSTAPSDTPTPNQELDTLLLQRALRSPPGPTPAFKRAATQFLSTLGGVAPLLEILSHSTDPKAMRLRDALLVDGADKLSFGVILHNAGVDADDFLRIFGGVRRSQITTLALNAGPEIMEGILERAKNRWVPCSGCWQTGQELDEQHQPTAKLHGHCLGQGWVMVEADKDAIEVWGNITKLTKPGGDVSIDARRMNVQQTAIFGVAGVGGAPDVSSIIKRADEQLITPGSVSRQLTSGNADRSELGAASDLPDTSDLVEAEVVGE